MRPLAPPVVRAVTGTWFPWCLLAVCGVALLGSRRSVGPGEAIESLRQIADASGATPVSAVALMRPEDCVAHLARLNRLAEELGRRDVTLTGLVLVEGDPEDWRQTIEAYHLPGRFVVVRTTAIASQLLTIGIRTTPTLLVAHHDTGSFAVYSIPEGVHRIGALLR